MRRTVKTKQYQAGFWVPVGNLPLDSVAVLEATLRDLRRTFHLEEVIQQGVLTHADIDHNIAKMVSVISYTTHRPAPVAAETAQILADPMRKQETRLPLAAHLQH